VTWVGGTRDVALVTSATRAPSAAQYNREKPMQRQRGFSLVELLFALLVLTIVITTTLAVFVERTRRLRQASNLILVYQVLSNEAEVQRRLPYDALASSPVFESSTALLAPLNTYNTVIDVQPRGVGIKVVTMTITWDQGSREAKLAIQRVDTGAGNLW
jgi:prepilin-type N-terminal cleavage/methylation domain-containing protein